MVRQVAEFNRSQRLVQVKLITLPEGDYGQEVATAAANGTLPDVLDFDGSESLQLRLGRRPQADRLVPDASASALTCSRRSASRGRTPVGRGA